MSGNGREEAAGKLTAPVGTIWDNRVMRARRAVGETDRNAEEKLEAPSGFEPFDSRQSKRSLRFKSDSRR